MEFLVNIDVRWPADGDADLYERLTAAERTRGRELIEAGVIRRIWRIPGRRANWGVWESADATALHEVIGSLPFYPWLDVTVIALAEHPIDRGWPTLRESS